MSSAPAVPALLLGGVDRAALAAAFAARLRAAGVPASISAAAAFTGALSDAAPRSVEDLYWRARITLVDRQEHLAAFDHVFDAAFRDSVLPVDPHARRSHQQSTAREDESLARVAGNQRDSGEDGASLPWHMLPHTARTSDHGDDQDVVLPELRASAVARIADSPFDELDDEDMALLARWLERASPRWPTRRSRRVRTGENGGRLELRATIAASRRTGWEPVVLHRRQQVHRPLRVTVLVDVSQSMQTWATSYLHLMRAFARTRRAETFAFSTSLTRLTPALSHHSPATAVALAGEQVVDRYGGTHLARCLGELLSSRHGSTVRGGVLVIASDGWDSDEPAALAAAMARARRRARRIVWLNPRAGAPGFEPLVGPMAAALPYCDAFLAADRLSSLPEVFEAISTG